MSTYIHEAMELDPTGLTADMLLYGQAVGQLTDDMLAFQQRIREQVAFYGGTAEVNLAELGELRRDALRSIRDLSAYQFGQSAGLVCLPKYNKVVYQFADVETMIATVKAHQPGITLCLVADGAFSYFAFSIWNGATLTIVTDKPVWCHPQQKQMVRNASRRLSERWDQNHFPYELLNSTQERVKALRGLFELEPDVVIWTVMMFELLIDKYWTKQLEPSYTSDQVRLLPSDKPEWEIPPTGQNQWLENKFNGSAQVPVPKNFGTLATLRDDLTWTSRYNRALYVNEAAEEVYEREKDTVMDWYLKHIRWEFLVDKVCSLSWPVQFDVYKDFSREVEALNTNWALPLRVTEVRPYAHANTDFTNRCTITGAPCTLHKIFRVSSPQKIALITGVPIEQLPEPLQHYDRGGPYKGNPLLERLDPMDWVVKNPWLQMRLDVCICLSKSGFHRRRAALGLSRHKF